MKRIMCLILLAALLFACAGCAVQYPDWLSRLTDDGEAEADGGFSVYRVAADPTQSGDLLRPERFPELDPSGLEPEAAAALLTSPAGDAALTSALPPDVTVESVRFENGVVTLTLSEGYLALTDMQKTTAAFCAVLTLTQLDGVEAVTIAAGGETVFAGLMPEDAFLTAADSDPYIRRLRLYFSDAEGRYLISEYHSLTLREDASAERYVVEELLRGPNNGELKSAIPAGTALRSCSTEGGVCTVDLSDSFYGGRPDTAPGERLAVYSLVDSLTALSEVRAVRILVEGEPIGTYVYTSLAEPLGRYEEPIGPVSGPKGEFDADLYLALPGLTALAPLPFRVNETGYESRAEAVLAKLFTAAEPGYPALFPSSASVYSVSVRGSECTVDAPEGFYASVPEAERTAAAASVTATLCALPEIDSVRFTVGGESAVIDGTDWTGPWHDIEEFQLTEGY